MLQEANSKPQQNKKNGRDLMELWGQVKISISDLKGFYVIFLIKSIWSMNQFVTCTTSLHFLGYGTQLENNVT